MVGDKARFGARGGGGRGGVRPGKSPPASFAYLACSKLFIFVTVLWSVAMACLVLSLRPAPASQQPEMHVNLGTRSKGHVDIVDVSQYDVSVGEPSEKPTTIVSTEKEASSQVSPLDDAKNAANIPELIVPPEPAAEPVSAPVYKASPMSTLTMPGARFVDTEGILHAQEAALAMFSIFPDIDCRALPVSTRQSKQKVHTSMRDVSNTPSHSVAHCAMECACFRRSDSSGTVCGAFSFVERAAACFIKMVLPSPRLVPAEVLSVLRTQKKTAPGITFGIMSEVGGGVNAFTLRKITSLCPRLHRDDTHPALQATPVNTSDGDIIARVAEPGQSCSKACAMKHDQSIPGSSMVCRGGAADFGAINNCVVLQRLWPDLACRDNTWGLALDLPGMRSLKQDYSATMMGLTSTVDSHRLGNISCHGGFEQSQRVCPCRPISLTVPNAPTVLIQATLSGTISASPLLEGFVSEMTVDLSDLPIVRAGSRKITLSSDWLQHIRHDHTLIPLTAPSLRLHNGRTSAMVKFVPTRSGALDRPIEIELILSAGNDVTRIIAKLPPQIRSIAPVREGISNLRIGTTGASMLSPNVYKWTVDEGEVGKFTVTLEASMQEASGLQYRGHRDGGMRKKLFGGDQFLMVQLAGQSASPQCSRPAMATSSACRTIVVVNVNDNDDGSYECSYIAPVSPNGDRTVVYSVEFQYLGVPVGVTATYSVEVRASPVGRSPLLPCPLEPYSRLPRTNRGPDGKWRLPIPYGHWNGDQMFLAASCALPRLTVPHAQSCLRGKHVAFMGDSHTRGTLLRMIARLSPSSIDGRENTKWHESKAFATPESDTHLHFIWSRSVSLTPAEAKPVLEPPAKQFSTNGSGPFPDVLVVSMCKSLTPPRYCTSP